MIPRISIRQIFASVVLAIFTIAGVASAAETPVQLNVQPAAPVLSGTRAKQRLLISGQYDNGTLKDVTAQCRYESSHPKIATITSAGVIHPLADGETTIRISLGTIVTETKVTVQRIADGSYNFTNDVLPILSRASCNQMGCHGSPKGKNGFRLSLFGADPKTDYQAIARDWHARLIDPMQPKNSLLLLKAAAQVPHGGGQKIKPGSLHYQLLRDWIAQQAPQGTDDDPVLERIEVYPKQRMLQKRDIQPLLVEAFYSDGTMADVTDLASYTSNDDFIATASPMGIVKATGTSEAIIVVGYNGRMAVSRMSIPQRSTVPFPTVTANNRIDEIVQAKLKMLNIAPSALSSDSEFLRRVFLDTLGTLPTPQEARRFLTDNRPEKRAILIDELLARDEFVDRQTLKWCDLLKVNRGVPSNLGVREMWAYYYWIRESFAANKPVDQFVEELVTASGNAFRHGPPNYFRVARDPQTMAEQTSQLFLGVRLECARCHNHPFEQITWYDNLGMASFFSGVKRKRRDLTEVIYADPRGSFRHPATRAVVEPKYLGQTSAAEVDDSALREQLAHWITAPENPWFARNMSNRVWSWLLGRGIVHEPDDFRSTNPPSNPELLDYLAGELVDSGYNLRHIYRRILNSRTYQLSSKPNKSNYDDSIHFSHYPLRRLDAEQLLDSFNTATNGKDRFPGLPLGMRAAQIPDPGVRSTFLDLFGRPKRSSACECERSGQMHVGQTLHLISSDHIESKLSARGNRLDQLIGEKATSEKIVDELYLSTLSRPPRDAEKQLALNDPLRSENQRQWAEDLLWALLNTKEFLFNH